MAWTDYYVDLSAGANGDGSSGTPWNSIANAITGLTTVFGGSTATAQSRVNVKGSGSYGATSVTFSLAGTSAFPIWWRGYSVTPGDCDADPTLARPTLAFTTGQVSVSGGFQVLSCLSVSGQWLASGSGGQISVSGANCWLHRCRSANTAASVNGRSIFLTSAAADTTLSECNASATTTAASCVSLTASRCHWFGGSARGGAVGIDSSGTSCVIVQPVIDDPGSGAGIQVAGAGSVVVSPTIYGAGTDGVRVTSSTNVCLVLNPLASTLGGFAVNQSSGTASSNVRVIGGGYFSATSGDLNGIVESLAFERVGSLAADPFTAAATHDFSLAAGSAARAAATPGRYEGESYTSYRDLGAVQHQDAGGGGGTYTDPGVANVKTGVTYTFNSVSETGTYDGSDRWTDPGVANVLIGVAYKANSATNNRTGTVTLPIVGDVESGVTFGASLGSTGTFVVPDPTEVAAGIGYGAGGTEFTGSLAGGGGTDWTAAERAQIRYRLGIDGTATAPSAATPTLGTLPANVTQWNGAAVPAPNVAGYPLVDVAKVNGAAASQADGLFQAATSGGGTLDAAAVARDGAYVGWRIRPITGSAADDWKIITGYTGATKAFTIRGAWAVTPAAGDQYTIDPPDPADLEYALGAAATLDANGFLNVNARDWGGTPVTGGLPNTAAPLSSPQTAAAVWGATRAGNATAGTFGEGVAGVNGNVTGNVVGNVTGNVAGNVVGSVGSLGTQARADVETAVWEARHANHLNAGTFGNFLDSSISGVSTGGLSATDIAAAVWRDLLTSGDFDVSGSAGALLKGNLDAAVSTRLSTVGYAAPPTAASIATTLLATPLVVRSLDGVSVPNVSDGLVAAWAAGAAKESVVGTAYTILQPDGASTLRTFLLTLDGNGNPTARS